jgi:hypothetical protein
MDEKFRIADLANQLVDDLLDFLLHVRRLIPPIAYILDPCAAQWVFSALRR